MTRIFGSILAVLLLAGAGESAASQIDSYAALPRVWAADLSPDGRHLATGCSPRGKQEICIFDLSGDQDPVVIPAPDGGRIVDFFWPGPDHLIYRVRSFQRVPLANDVEWINVTRAVSYALETATSAVLLGEIANVSGLSEISSVLTDRPDRVAMELTLIEDAVHRRGDMNSAGGYSSVIYEVDLNDGSLIDTRFRSQGPTVEFLLDKRGRMLLDVRYEISTGTYSIFRARGRERIPIFRDVYPAAWPRIYGLIDNDTAIAIAFPEQGLFRMDLASGEFTRFELNGDVVFGREPVLDEYTGGVVGFAFTDTLPRQVFIDDELAQVHNALFGLLEEESVLITAWTPDRSKMVVEARDPGQPAQYYLLDLTSSALGLLDEEMTLPDGEQVGEREPLIYEASDGLAIPAYVTRPANREDADELPPLIVMPHGGPQARDTAEFDWWAAYYASLGYIVLQPNFRGSSGYGLDFVEAGYGEFGQRMIDDIIEGAHFLMETGQARPGAYCVVGASYGGYAALMAALRDADNVACVATFAAVTHPFALMADREAFPEVVRYWEQYIGSRYTAPEDQIEITPARRARDFRVPVLMMHGSADTTVPEGQMRLMRNAIGLRQRFDFVLLRDEDHFLGSAYVRRRLLRETGEFLQEHLPVNDRRGTADRGWLRRRLEREEPR